MEDDSKINIYVNSKNRKSDETASNFNVMIPDGLLKIKNNQSFELNVISFNGVNCFYHCNNNTNRFQIIFRNNVYNYINFNFITKDLVETYNLTDTEKTQTLLKKHRHY